MKDQRTARMGERRGWAPPLAWDDIDNPDERANYGHNNDRTQTADELADHVARLTRAGLSASQIADQLDITRRTVVRHRRRTGVAA